MTSGTTDKIWIARFSWLRGFQDDYHKVLVESWSPYIGGILLAVVCAVLMLKGIFWGVFGGLKLFGDYFNNFIGLGSLLGISQELKSPLMHRVALMDIVLLLGALSAALISRQFAVNRPPPLEYVWGAVGGSLMGVGATLAGGCTVGGFFTPAVFASAAGWMMWIGLTLGALVGLKLLLWTMEHINWGMTPPQRANSVSPLRRFFPLLGLLILLSALLWATQWFSSAEAKLSSRAIIIVAGFGLGFVLHRSRFCFARVFREPFMTAEGDMPKAMMLTIALAMPLGSLLIQSNTLDPYSGIPATFWLGSVAGGFVFGVGMIFAGGCATGSLWRAAEGHVKLMVAMFFFSWVGSISSALFRQWGLLQTDVDIDFLDGIPEISRLGYQSFLPDLFAGWGWVYLLTFCILLVWYLVIRYNESTERFTVL